MKTVINKLKNKNILDIAIILFLTSRFLTTIFVAILGRKGIFAAMGVVFIVYLIAMIKNIKDKQFEFISFFSLSFLSVTLLFLSIYFEPKIKYWAFDHEWGFFVKVCDPRKAIFGFLVILIVKNYKEIKDDLLIAARLNAIYLLIQMILYLSVGDWRYYFNLKAGMSLKGSYNMSFGYELMFVVIVFMLNAWREESRKKLVLSSFLFALSIYYGPRGLIVNYLALTACIFIFAAKGKEKKKYAIKFILATTILSFVFLITQNQIEKVSYKLTSTTADKESEDKKPNKSRNLEMMSSGNMTSSNGRTDIYKIALKQIKKNPFLGSGVYGDRPYVGRDFKWGYSHSILLEMVLSFGIVGVLILLYLIYISIKLLRNSEDEKLDVIIILIALSSKLLISDSFWFLNYFWMYIGMIYLNNHEEKKLNIKYNIFLALILLASMIGSGVLFINRDIKNQDFNVITFDKPKVIVAFEEGSEINKIDNYEYLIQKGKTGTAFIKNEKNTRDFSHEMNFHTIVSI